MEFYLSFRTTLIVTSSFLDAFQKVADLATGTRGECFDGLCLLLLSVSPSFPLAFFFFPFLYFSPSWSDRGGPGWLMVCLGGSATAEGAMNRFPVNPPARVQSDTLSSLLETFRLGAVLQAPAVTLACGC